MVQWRRGILDASDDRMKLSKDYEAYLGATFSVVEKLNGLLAEYIQIQAAADGLRCLLQLHSLKYDSMLIFAATMTIH